MNRKDICSLLIFTTITLFSNAQEIGFPIIRNYTTKEYNNSPQIFSAIQDNKGMMYFGVGGGIMVYDGISWLHFPIDKKAQVYDLAFDKNGRIYLAANSEFGYMISDKSGNTSYTSLTHLINDTTFKPGIAWSVKCTSRFVYFRTFDAILQYSPTTEKLLIFKADKNDRFSLDYIYRDIYYTKLNNKGLMKIENDKLISIPQAEIFKDKYSLVVLPYNTSTLLIPTRTEGLFLYQTDKDTLSVKFPLSKNDFITDNNIYNASVYQKEYYVLGSLKKGGLLIDKTGTVLQQYQESNLLQSNQILKVTSDANQNIWFGTSNGISKSEHSLDLSYWDKNAGLNGSVLNVIRYNSTIYIATSTLVYYIDKNNQIQEVQNIPIGQNWCFLETKNKKSLLVGTSSGIYEIRGKNAGQIYQSRHVFKLVQSIINPDRLYAGIGDSFFSFKYDNGKWISEGDWEGIKEEIHDFIEDETGELWISTYRNGSIRVTPDYENITKPKKIKYYNSNDGLSSLVNIVSFHFKNNILWGSEKGLFAYNPETDRFEPFCELGSQFCNGSRDVVSLKELNDGKIVISPYDSRKTDIGYLQPNNKGGYSWVYAPFRRIPIMTIETVYVESSGIIWIGGSEGLYRYDMSKDTKNYARQFNCLIRKISLNVDSLLYSGTILNSNLSEFQNSETLIDYEYNSIKFEFAAPFFDQEDKTMYCYKLEGFDKEWSNWSREFKKEYTNLREGTYTFHVKARNVYDVESETSTFQMTILPPFYRSWWAYGFYIVVLALFIVLIVKLYTRYLRKQREQLKQMVEERTMEIINQKEEIDAALHSLKDAQGRLIQSEKMASLGILAAGIAHEINNPLNFIQGGVTGLKQYFDANPVCPGSNIDFFIKGISEGIERAEEIVSSLYHFSQSDVNRTETIDIHNIIDNCLLMLMFETKNRIEIVKNYTNIPYMLIGNEANLHQAFLNILTNAVQSIKDKGKIMIKSEIESKLLKVIFSDTGCGIREEDLPKILDPFFTTKDPGKGTGLGLSITYNIIKEHQGSIVYQSKWGEGTTATLRIPLK